MLTIVTSAQAPSDFESWKKNSCFSEINAHPSTGFFGARYYPNVFGSDVRDVSFAVVDRDKPLVLVPCTVGKFCLDYYGMPIRIFPSAQLQKEIADSAIEKAFSHIDQMRCESQTERIVVREDVNASVLSAVGKQCLSRGGTADLRISATCDLQLSEADLRKELRKSYKSLVNWGERNLRMEFVGADNRDRSLFARYQEFHHQVAGRSTRPQSSWDAMFEIISAGHGELVMGFLEGSELVAGTMIVDGDKIASYASGVYDREKFDKPMAHWPLWLGILRSKERGLKEFDIGDVPLSSDDKKQFDIGYFKRGFSSRLSTHIFWTCNGVAAN